MEIKNKWLLVAIKIGLDILWYVNFIAIVITLFTLIKQTAFRDDHYYSIPIDLPGQTMERYFPTYMVKGENVSIQVSTGTMFIDSQNPYAEIPGIISFIFNKLLFVGILYNLRKVFRTFYRNEPFQYENIKRLKIAALYIALFWPLHVAYDLAYYFILKSYTTKFHFHRTPDWQMLAVAAIVYITAEILRYGFELKKENEGFI